MLQISPLANASLEFSYRKNKVGVRHPLHERHFWMKEEYFKIYRPQLHNIFLHDWQKEPKRFKENGYYNLILNSGELLIGFLYQNGIFYSSSYKPVRQVKSGRVQFFTESL
jgi:hypothetical protein